MSYRLPSTVMARESVADRARLRIREEMHERGISQRDLAEVLTKHTGERWTQSKVGKVLTGRVQLQVEIAAIMAEGVGISLVEAVRDRGLEFHAELTPTEMRMLELLRQRPDAMLGTLYHLGMAKSQPAPVVVGPKKRTARLLDSVKRQHHELR